jgi:hypothetical protein
MRLVFLELVNGLIAIDLELMDFASGVMQADFPGTEPLWFDSDSSCAV